MTFNQRPPFFSASAICIQDGMTLELYLDVNEEELIENVYYTSTRAEQYKESFESICVAAKGLSVFEAYSVIAESSIASSEQRLVFDLPLLLFQRALDDYRGLDSFYFNQIAKKSEQRLLCRCFGVYEEDIEKLLQGDRNLLLADLKRKTPAGSLCGACQEDLEDLYFEVRSEFPPTLPEKRKVKRIKGLSPIQWIKKIAHGLEEFKLVGPKELNIIKIDISYYQDLKVTLSCGNLNSDQKTKLESVLLPFLRSTVDRDLVVLFS